MKNLIFLATALAMLAGCASNPVLEQAALSRATQPFESSMTAAGRKRADQIEQFYSNCKNMGKSAQECQRLILAPKDQVEGLLGSIEARRKGAEVVASGGQPQWAAANAKVGAPALASNEIYRCEKMERQWPYKQVVRYTVYYAQDQKCVPFQFE